MFYDLESPIDFMRQIYEVLDEDGVYMSETDHLIGIRKQMETAPVDKEGITRLVGYLTDIDARRNRDWKKVFPEIAVMVDNILNSSATIK